MKEKMSETVYIGQVRPPGKTRRRKQRVLAGIRLQKVLLSITWIPEIFWQTLIFSSLNS